VYILARVGFMRIRKNSVPARLQWSGARNIQQQRFSDNGSSDISSNADMRVGAEMTLSRMMRCFCFSESWAHRFYKI